MLEKVTKKSKGLIFNLLFDLDKLYIYIIVPLFVTLHYISYSHNGKYYYIYCFLLNHIKEERVFILLFLKFEK